MKRRRQRQASGHSQPLRRSQRIRARSVAPLLDALRPILPHFHSFLTDDNAARLLRTSRTAAVTLLPSYTFTSHTFKLASLDCLRRLRDLCLTYRLRFTRLGLRQLPELTFEPNLPHLSPIPPFVTALSFHPTNEYHVCSEPSLWHVVAPWRRWCRLLPHSSPQWFGEEANGWQLTLASASLDDLCRGRSTIFTAAGDLRCPLPPGVLPDGLRELHFCGAYQQPLQPGSLPSTLTFLQLGRRFQQPLTPGPLPPSLLHLILISSYSHPLVPGSLPASLEMLSLYGRHSPPLQVGVLPSGLKVLHLAMVDLQPGPLPPSLLFLCFDWLNYPLQHNRPAFLSRRARPG